MLCSAPCRAFLRDRPRGYSIISTRVIAGFRLRLKPLLGRPLPRRHLKPVCITCPPQISFSSPFDVLESRPVFCRAGRSILSYSSVYPNNSAPSHQSHPFITTSTGSAHVRTRRQPHLRPGGDLVNINIHTCNIIDRHHRH